MARNLARAPTPTIPPFREDATGEKKDVQEWMRTFDVYIECIQETMGHQILTDGYKKSTLQLLLGTAGLKDYATSPAYQNRAQQTFDEFRQHVVDHFRRRPSKVKSRVDFQKRQQEPGETIHDFLQALRRIAEDCEFADVDDALQTQLVAGTSDQRAQTELMAKVDLPGLDDIVKILQASETAADDLKKLRGTPAGARQAAVAFNKGRGSGRFWGAGPRTMPGRDQQRQLQNAGNVCPGCGTELHAREGKCPAWGKKCSKCGRLNHFARVCQDGQGKRGRGRGYAGGRAGTRNGPGRNNVAVQFEDDDEANRCQDPNQTPSLIYEQFQVRTVTPTGETGYIPIKMLVDTGANTSILSEGTWRKKLGGLPIQKSRASPRGANGEKLQGCLGTVTTKVAYGGRKSEWVHPLVAVPKKDGGVRITSDLTRLNKVVIPDRFPIPRIKDILRELGTCQIFSKLDLRKGYFHIPLHPESRPLTTTNTPLGLRQYCRLPMGLKDSASAFQQRLQEVLQNIPGARVYIDDIIIGGRNQAEHDERLRRVLCQLQKAGFRLQIGKVILSKPAIPAFGYILSAEGIRPDPENVASIKHAPAPTDMKQLQRFLGMVTYFQDFLPDLTSIVEPLRKLTRQEAPNFEWGVQQQLAFETIKAMLEATATLKPFDPERATVVTVDASDVGIGAVLSQQHKSGERPVAYWNKTLDTAQRNYSASEKEALACILACEHWEDLLLGTSFILRTDHQALTSMFANPKTRRQSSKFSRWKERLAEFDFKVQYLPGNSNHAADYLSRLERKATQVGVKMEQAAGVQLDWLAEEAMKDPEYQELIADVEQGRKPTTRSFKSMADKLTVQQGLVTSDGRIVPPAATCPEILRIAHHGHPGMVKTKQLLRRTYFWPRMNQQIENMISGCEQCQASTKTRKIVPPQPETTIPRPSTPGEQWGLDITGPFPNGQNIIVAIDYASRYPEILITKSTTTATITNWLQSLWDRQGLPAAVVTDNGPQFISKDFEDFLVRNDVHHYPIAVYNPRENGLVERFNGYLKAGMETFAPGDWQTQVQQLMAAYRRMPVDGTKTALDLFFGRKVRVPVEPNVSRPLRRTVSEQRRLTQSGQQEDPYTGWSIFGEGEEVLTRIPQVPKGRSPWSEPKTVKKVLGAYTFLLSDGQVWSARKLKRWAYQRRRNQPQEGGDVV